MQQAEEEKAAREAAQAQAEAEAAAAQEQDAEESSDDYEEDTDSYEEDSSDSQDSSETEGSEDTSEDSGILMMKIHTKRTMQISMRETLTAMNQKIHLTARHPQTVLPVRKIPW